MDQSNNVHLKWNKHQATLVSIFDTLLDNEKLTDCTISAEGQYLRVHKIILSACSPYFEELFTKNYEKHPIIILHGVKYDTVKALMDFMYRGEVNVPQEELSGVLKLSESLQVRGLSGSGCVDDVNMQKGSGRDVPPVFPETLPSQPAACVSRFTSGENESEGKSQSIRGNSPVASSQDGCPVGADAIPKSTRKYRKNINHSESDQRPDQNMFGDFITPDLDSMHQLPSQRQVMPTTSSSAGERGFSPVHCQSMCRELKSSSGEIDITENEQFLMPEAVLADKRSKNLSTCQQEISLETKSEALESQMEIVEDLTLNDDDDDDDDDDNDYHDDDYLDEGNSAEDNTGEGRRMNECLTYEGNFRSQGINDLHPPLGSDYLRNSILSTPSTVLSNRFDCPTCGKSYLYRSGLLRHVKHECGKEPQFQCPRCNKRCARSDQLRSHMSSRRCRMLDSVAYFEGNR
ncbi:protein tramtrack, beta isoform-like isoform X5 [Schistocerca americana]|uniref:protein tramtrack, beta isoform-like isoform X5 n=1 Tax=Schistocerca americana TaxID=7009 RepID=UPI001F4F4549|nr:protein tramtrack, beta isoform-like isoform X5 [Schistocerca americana]